MEKPKIKQHTSSFINLNLLILIAVPIIFSSCIQLRYTDYGKPLDFLKTKNQFYASHKQKNDTASIFVAKTISLDTTKKIILELKHLSEKEILLEKPTKEINVTQSVIISKQSDLTENKKKDSILNVPSKNPQISTIKHDKKIVIKKNEVFKGPGWWEEFWSSLWNFVLKWLLIILAFFVVLVLIIWSIYLLITLLAGPVAGSIFLAIALILFWILINSN